MNIYNFPGSNCKTKSFKEIKDTEFSTLLSNIVSKKSLASRKCVNYLFVNCCRSIDSELGKLYQNSKIEFNSETETEYNTKSSYILDIGRQIYTYENFMYYFNTIINNCDKKIQSKLFNQKFANIEFLTNHKQTLLSNNFKNDFRNKKSNEIIDAFADVTGYARDIIANYVDNDNDIYGLSDTNNFDNISSFLSEINLTDEDKQKLKLSPDQIKEIFDRLKYIFDNEEISDEKFNSLDKIKANEAEIFEKFRQFENNINDFCNYIGDNFEYNLYDIKIFLNIIYRYIDTINLNENVLENLFNLHIYVKNKSNNITFEKFSNILESSNGTLKNLFYKQISDAQIYYLIKSNMYKIVDLNYELSSSPYIVNNVVKTKEYLAKIRDMFTNTIKVINDNLPEERSNIKNFQDYIVKNPFFLNNEDSDLEKILDEFYLYIDNFNNGILKLNDKLIDIKRKYLSPPNVTNLTNNKFREFMLPNLLNVKKTSDPSVGIKGRATLRQILIDPKYKQISNNISKHLIKTVKRKAKRTHNNRKYNKYASLFNVEKYL
jgi:hypothetical protein